MKTVKECSSCGTYNKFQLDNCNDCGFHLPNTLITVEDDLDKNPNFSSREEEKLIVEKTIEIKVCPSCAHRNERIKVTCEHCGKFLKDVEIQVENYLNSKEPETILLSFGSSKIIIKVTNNKTQSYGYKDFLEIRDFKTISSKHFIMYKDHLDIFIIDTSVNGTYINKTKLMGGVPLKINKHDILTLADIKFTIDDIN
jgi:hypothetical protein